MTDDDEEVEYLTEDDLYTMQHRELLAFAKELDIEVPNRLLSKRELVELILDSGDD